MTQGHRALAAARVRVDVAGSSANLGPGFDAVGLALELRDVVETRCTPASDPQAPRTSVHVSGEGAGEVPTDDRHLVARWVRGGLAGLGAGADHLDLDLTCRNAVPHGRGLGSSATAVVAGLLTAWTLVHGEAEQAGALTRAGWLVSSSAAAEGHGDNAAASVLGGAVLAWADAGGYRAVPLEVSDGLALVTCVPGEVLLTDVARALLPATVPHADAAFTGARAGLLVHALRGHADLLLAATEDRIHQSQRSGAMPGSAELLAALRAEGVAACVSGAGPSLLCLGSTAATVQQVADTVAPGAWQVDARPVGGPARAEVLG
ncbi:homoserine kinase [Aquipuribacter nitratireducens]|uniref:Homoserine kinase n=1 Tax=Aquipuribacter nitratireducens TaxID=650104 RepID=A0ABW0GLK7_9MICO